MMRTHNPMKTAIAVFAAALLAAAVPGTAFGATLAGETYGSDFKMTGVNHSVAATGGQYRITGTGPPVDSTYELPGPGAMTPFTVSAQVGSDPGAIGNFNVGMKIGDNTISVHPGYGGGAFRVNGPGGFGNQNVGFTPAVSVLHKLTVTGDGAGNFNVTLTDGANPLNTYSRGWTNAGNPVDTIGVIRSGDKTPDGLFDDLSVPPAPLETYSSDFSAQVRGRIEATGGQLQMQGPGTNILTYPGHTGDLLISGKVGSSPGSGNTNVGIRIGENNFVFHPNYFPIPGAFRVEGPGAISNQNMGFVPAGGPLHDMEIAVEAATGKFTIAVTDAGNPNNIYVRTFTNPAYAPGTDQIGFRYSSGSGGDEGRFDDLQIAELKPTEGLQSWVNAIQAGNPLHWYRLSETGSIAADSGTGGLHGIYRNGVTQGVAGPTNGAAQFDGADDTITLGGSDLGGPWTAEFVVKKLAKEPSGILLGRHTSTGAGAGALKLDQWNNTGQVGFTQFTVADRFFTPGYSAPTGEFVHLTFVGIPSGLGKGISLYEDGILVGTNSNYMALPLWEIGSFEPGNMVLDEVVIFNRALGDLEIRAHADALTAPPAVIPEPMTMLAVGMGIASVGGYVRKRRSA